MGTVKKAVVLAAGLGTRLRPFTCVTPKPLMPVWGEPMLARIVSLLRGWGVEDIVVNCHYLHEQVEAWCKANGCRPSYEPEILGTGGVLNPLRGWIGGDDFYLVNGDIVVEGLEGLDGLGGSGSSDIIGTCLVTEEGPRTIEVEPESGFVTNWKSDDAGYDGTLTYCGVAGLKAEILKYVEPTGFSSIVQAYERAMMDGKFMKAVKPKDLLWTDAGTIERYIDLNRDGDDNAFADFPQVRVALESLRVQQGLRDTRSARDLQGICNSRSAQGALETLSDPIQFLGARGSDRVFFRAGDRIVILYDDAKRGENARYAGHARWLKAKGISVPEVLVDRPDDKVLVMSWAGSEKKMTFEEETKVIEELVRFHALGSAAVSEGLVLEPPFDAALFKWERELFAEHCLGSMFGLEMSVAVRRELEGVADALEREPKALVHRDFQSTNVLWKNGKLSFIDFQGMRLGPAAYDLASFVYDPYVAFTDERRRALVALYAKTSGCPEIEKVLPLAAVQRLVQCLGAYGRLASVGQPQFLKHVVPALQNLLSAADEADLDAVGALAEDLIAKSSHVHHYH